MKIKYTVILEEPVVTAALGVIGKDIDITLKRDEKGNPYFSGKQIKGILKERILQFKRGLGENEGTIQRFVEIYFGKEGNYIQENRNRQLRFSNLVLKEPQKFEETCDTGTRYGIRVNRKTRTVEENSLFNYEFLTTGIQFEGNLEIPSQTIREDLKFILASLFHLESIGGLKSRGLGRVQVEIEGKSIEFLDNIVKETFEKKTIIDKACFSKEMKRYSYTLELKENIVLGGREVGNYVEVRNSIQGSSIRGAMIAYLINYEGASLEDVVNIEASDALTEEEILLSCFKTKYPLNSLQQKLSQEDGEYIQLKNNYAYVDKLIYSGSEVEQIKLERVSRNTWETKGNEISVKIDHGTKSAETGMLFNTEYASYTGRLQGDILLPKDSIDCQKTYTIYLGKYRSKGFGKAEISFREYETSKEKLETRIERLHQQVNLEGEYLISFDVQSDIIFPTQVLYDISKQWKILVGLGEDFQFVSEKSFVHVGKLKGFNAINNCRKMDELIISAGSVISFKVPEYQKHLEFLNHIEEKGIGLRRKEGFGRVSICTKRGDF